MGDLMIPNHSSKKWWAGISIAAVTMGSLPRELLSVSCSFVIHSVDRSFESHPPGLIVLLAFWDVLC